MSRSHACAQPRKSPSGLRANQLDDHYRVSWKGPEELRGHTAEEMAFQRYQSQQSASSEASDIGWSEGDPLCRLPYEVLLHLFDYVPPREIINACRVVCKGWRGFFDEPSFWQLRMKRRSNYDPRLDRLSGINWAKLYLYTVHEPNLVKSFDSNGDLSLKPWRIANTDWSNLNERYFIDELYRASRGGNIIRQQQRARDGWTIEEWIKKDDDKDKQVLKENLGCTKNYVTTFYWCCRWQLIDLYEYGFTSEVVNQVQPPIHVSEWFCARWDCGSLFKMTLALLDKEFKFLKTYQHSVQTPQWEGGELGWRKVTHTFHDYGTGVRYVLFVDGGKDTQFWAGHYGSKMAAANVHVEFTQ